MKELNTQAHAREQLVRELCTDYWTEQHGWYNPDHSLEYDSHLNVQIIVL